VIAETPLSVDNKMNFVEYGIMSTVDESVEYKIEKINRNR